MHLYVYALYLVSLVPNIMVYKLRDCSKNVYYCVVGNFRGRK